MKRKHILFVTISILIAILAGCAGGTTTTTTQGLPHVLAIESFLADIAQNVAGDRLSVEILIPLGVDPHAYQPTPQDAARITDADILILNGANLEAYLDPILQNAGSHNQLIITASDGLTAHPDPSGENTGGDPHFWLDPNNTVKYVENIRDGFTQADPVGGVVYTTNSDKYIGNLRSLDAWITAQVQDIPVSRRLLVTNHDSLGYFASRYGFTVVGAIVPSISSSAAPSAQELAALIDTIRKTGTPAIFLEAGTNPQLGDQIASETGVKVVTGLYVHSLSAAGGPAATYIDMMKYDVTLIVDALK